MGVWIYSLVLALSGLEVSLLVHGSPPSCQHQFPASFLGVIEQNIDSPDAFIVPDPELTFLKGVMKIRDGVIQNIISNSIKFFNETFGLDFSLSPPNDQNEYVYQNATLRLFKVAENIEYTVTLNNWIQTGRTRSTCYQIRDGGFQVTFSADLTLHGSYGGASGKPAGVTEALYYGFYQIEVCQQSPVVIQYQSASPLRHVPIDGIGVINCDLFNRNLGYGKAMGAFTATPDPSSPGQYRAVGRNAFTFAAKEN